MKEIENNRGVNPLCNEYRQCKNKASGKSTLCSLHGGNPIIKENLISPPPKLSLLNILSPNNLITNITKNITNPLPTDCIRNLKFWFKYNNNIIIIVPITKGLSNIIKYLKSLI